MPSVGTLIDLKHNGVPGVIGAYVLDGPEPAIVDCGPASCADALESGLEQLGLTLAGVAHILLTHIHPDHAGGAGELVRRQPALTVHVHEVGAPHLVEPSRLTQSARRLYGEWLTALFGDIDPVPEENVRLLGERVLDLAVVAAPGHARHQVAFLDDDGVCYPGDAAGVMLRRDCFVYPAAAPPEISMPEWLDTVDRLQRLAPSSLRLTHFAEVTAVAPHLERVRERLEIWAARVEQGMSEGAFVAAAQAELEREASPAVTALFTVVPFPTFAHSYAGIRRYFDKQREGATRDQRRGARSSA